MQKSVLEEGKLEPADYNKRERDTVAVSLKNMITKQRVAIRVIKALMENEKYRKFEGVLRIYRAKLEEEIFNQCEGTV